MHARFVLVAARRPVWLKLPERGRVVGDEVSEEPVPWGAQVMPRI